MIAKADVKDIIRPKCHGCFESAPYCSCDDFFGSDFADRKWANMQARPRYQRALYRLAGYR